MSKTTTSATLACAGLCMLGGLALAQMPGTLGGGNDPLRNVSGGQRITWPAGDNQAIVIANRRFNPAITIDGSRATFSSIVIRNSSGITVDRGTIIGPGGRSYGVNIIDSTDVGIRNMTISGAHRGIVITRSQRIRTTGNQLVGLLAEGINIAQSQHVVVENNVCRNFNPTLATFNADGTMIADGDHPDCIQGWSRPGYPVTSDVRIVGNSATGNMQGIFFGNHVRNGVNDGGFDRIVISRNTIHVASPHGISIYDARDSEVTNNRITTVAGARSQRPPFNAINAMLNVVRAARTVACGNVVSARPTTAGTAPCPRAPAL